MSRPTFIHSKVVYHDNSREYNIDARGRNLAEVLRACETEEIEQVQPEQPPTDQLKPKNHEDILPIPPEGKYGKVREYIQERCRFDKDFKAFIETHSRVELCERLTKEFGWLVDDNSLGRNINRNRRP